MKTARRAPRQWRTPSLIGTSVVRGTELVTVVENDFPVEVKVVSEDPVVVIVVSDGVLATVLVRTIVLTRPPGAVDSNVSSTTNGDGAGLYTISDQKKLK